MNKKKYISDLCSQLDQKFYETLDVENMTVLKPSDKRIENLVFQKLHTEPTTAPQAGKRGPMTKKTIKTLLIAAILCMFATTVFAMAGGISYFRSIFGSTADNVEQDILAPGLAAEDSHSRMVLESMLTDGYRINLIVSLTPLTKEAAREAGRTNLPDLFRVELTPSSSSGSEAESTASYTCSELPEFAVGDKRFYHLQLDSLTNCTGWDMNISLAESLNSLTIESRVEGAAAAREYEINQDIDGNLTVETVQLSPLGVLVIGNEKQASGGLPTPTVSVTFKDGSTEELMSPMSFDAGDGETVIGGGGAVIGSDPINGPLVTTTHGQRNPDGKVVTAGEFCRVIRMDDVASISVNGTEYPAS